MKADVIVLSDLHLGSKLCKEKDLLHLLNNLPTTRSLVLNGDILEGPFVGLGGRASRILQRLGELVRSFPVTFVMGNHDGDSSVLAGLLGMDYGEAFTVVSGGKTALFVHGHQFDEFIQERPNLSYLATLLFNFLPESLMREVRAQTVDYARSHEKVYWGSTEYAIEQNAHMVFCGHTHYPCVVKGEQTYVNTGGWTDHRAYFALLEEGEVTLCEV